MRVGLLKQVFNHVVLPPKLPGKQDADLENVEGELHFRVLAALNAIKDCSRGEVTAALDRTLEALETCTLANEQGEIHKDGLADALQSLTIDHAIILQLKEQNACLLIRQSNNESVTFEAFETSPPANIALASQGALEWDFPSIAVALPLTKFHDPVFQEALISFLVSASLESLDEFAAQARKGGVTITETRNTVDPALITEFLMTLLDVNGFRVYPPLLRKRVKDDVIWDDALIPWRRCPYWLVIRVSVQRLLYLSLGDEIGRAQYKFFMCYFLNRLLQDSCKRLDPDLCHLLKAKLCRRLAKLETYKAQAPPAVSPEYERLFGAIGLACQGSIESTNLSINYQWNAFKEQSRRVIPRLPFRASKKDLELTLPNSLPYFKRLFDLLQETKPVLRFKDPNIVPTRAKTGSTAQFDELHSLFSQLAEMELLVESTSHEVPSSKTECEKVCIEIVDFIKKYTAAVGDAYAKNPEQMGVYILTIFELWVVVDKCALIAYPLLHEFHPRFEPEMLDVLLLTRWVDMKRLLSIQQYLGERRRRAGPKAMSIFADPVPGCFADRYFESDAAGHVQDLQRDIKKASSLARKQKEGELAQVNQEYEDLSQSIRTSSCTQRLAEDGSHDIRGCSHCFYIRSLRRLKIKVHEDFLPMHGGSQPDAVSRCMVFELGIPQAFAAYRNVTWNLVIKLCLQEIQPSSEQPRVLLEDYQPLAKFDTRRHRTFSLASTTKSYLMTHYSEKRLPARPEAVLLPNALNVAYYDSTLKHWAYDAPRSLSLAHHFRIQLPKELPFSSLFASQDFEASGSGPSSYQTISSMTKCPPQVTVHEYMAHQNIFAGMNRRWLSVLIELGSSNVNFSLQDTMALFRHVVLQVGPQLEDNALRAVHVVFSDEKFCNRLAQQIDKHIEAISGNWRESYYMESLLTLTIRLCSLCHQRSRAQANRLLMKIRQVTLRWLELLRLETRNAEEEELAERMARYGFMSALLCRRTFALYVVDDEEMDEEAFMFFNEATLAMQEYLIVDLGKFTTDTKNMFVRDIKTTYSMKGLFPSLVKKYPGSLERAIATAWPETEGAPRTYTKWKFLDSPNNWWVTSYAKVPQDDMLQVVHYHILEGHLFVDGKALGKLPTEMRDSEVIKELFGNERLLAFPSNMPGMSHVLGFTKEGHQVHLGLRDKQLIVRACNAHQVLEYVPPRVFGTENNPDVPRSLVHDCVHWIDLNTKVVEARRKPIIWKHRPANWLIDMRARKAQRRSVFLVNPHSALFDSVAKTLMWFEHPYGLTVYQPEKRSLSVELKRLDLDFFVNGNRLLQRKQFASEIDPCQDAGTLYGLQSMIVLRDLSNYSKRSIITPLGPIHYERKGIHVHVKMGNDGSYARFMIDDVLGRLQCAPEPRLLYNKAQMHAFTSFVIPDPLTGRTGTEEALKCLQSGCCQPWTALDPLWKNLLTRMSYILTPKREYYPKGVKQQQKVTWDSQLTTTIQHGAFQPVIDTILEKSRRLSLFHIEKEDETMEEIPGFTHLKKRALWRQSIYERPGLLSTDLMQPHDLHYSGRCDWDSYRSSNTREIVSAIYIQPRNLTTSANLLKKFENQPLIGGYENTLVTFLLEDCLSMNIAEKWGAIANFCLRSKTEDSYKVMFPLGLMAFRKEVDIELVRTLAAFFVLQDLRCLKFPRHSSFVNFKRNEKPDPGAFEAIVKRYWKPHQKENMVFSKKQNGTKKAHFENAKVLLQKWQSEQEKESIRFVQNLIDQWPNRQLTIDGYEDTGHIELEEALEAILPEWDRLRANLEFERHVLKVQDILQEHYTPFSLSKRRGSPTTLQVFGPERTKMKHIPRLGDDLMQKRVPSHVAQNFWKITSEALRNPDIDKMCLDLDGLTLAPRQKTPEIEELEAIVDRLGNTISSVRLMYSEDLKKSISALKMVKDETETTPDIKFNFDQELADKRALVRQCFEYVSSCNVRFGWMMRSRKKDTKRFMEEYNNRGHENWTPSVYPDWLLLEIDSNIRIREDQVTVALEMINPSSRSNSALQMNMGQGKTSVIMPMIACAVANGSMLSRFIVPKALLTQTEQILQSKIGGLVGREITHIPFSRRSPTTHEALSEYRELHNDMLCKSGVILDIPEHILSFGLSGLQRMSDAKTEEAVEMVSISRWLGEVCRDVLDECDFSLAVKTQLIYPSGSQLHVDGHPRRWEVIQMILTLVSEHLKEVKRKFPKSLDVVDWTAKAFPMAYFLRKDAEDAIISKIVEDICQGRSLVIPVRDCTRKDQQAIRRFISEEVVDENVAERVSKMFPGVLHARKNLYLLRGLLVHGILMLCLKKRWNVQYGLHHQRDPMAVPFRAKGVPSDQAEWGHPDVAILFTCLAFYYDGLNENQLRLSLQSVLKSDDPATEYDRWTQASATLPEPLRHWNIINVEDSGQIGEIWRHLRFSAVVINYFLNHFVFPVHAKQFSIKLQASGWDVPLLSPNPSSRPKQSGAGLTTGFSGTNDNRRLLPLTIEQRDLPRLSHTNAEVLTYLLQKRNREYIHAVQLGKRLSEENLLQTLTNKNIRILIDAGAFILEMNNYILVKTWLQKDTHAQAAVYFENDDKAWVLYKNGKRFPLLATPFAENMENCLVYLDEAHTRGTDLKLPVEAKGALTLGLNQTKDHTVQAAMRLRQLRTTQSVVFVAPPEVHQSVLDVCNKSPTDKVDSVDVVTWLLDQTCRNLEELQPLYYSQGVNFCRRMQAATMYNGFLDNQKHRQAYLNVLQLPEQQTLEQLYQPKASNEIIDISDDPIVKSMEGELGAFMSELSRRQNQSKATSGTMNSALEEVEQEREVAYEIEEERQIQRPPYYKPLSFRGLHPTLREFVASGILAGGAGYVKASQFVESTELGSKYSIKGSNLLQYLYFSDEFTRTVKGKPRNKLDNMIRPVNWILWSKKSSTALIIIPEEAEVIIPMLRASKGVAAGVHLLTYASPVTRRMLHFNDLDFYTLPYIGKNWSPPLWLAIEVGIFAGRLYFPYADYKAIIDHLCMNFSNGANETAKSNSNEPSSLFSLAPIEPMQQEKQHTPIARKALTFLYEWLAVRRSGQDISHTPMGYVCQDWSLREDHPFFVAAKEQTDNGRLLSQMKYSSTGTSYEEFDEEYDSGVEDVDETFGMESMVMSGREDEVAEAGNDMAAMALDD